MHNSESNVEILLELNFVNSELHFVENKSQTLLPISDNLLDVLNLSLIDMLISFLTISNISNVSIFFINSLFGVSFSNGKLSLIPKMYEEISEFSFLNNFINC